MVSPPRVAFFPDSFHEINGLALTARALDAYARRRRLPFLSVRGGTRHRWAPEADGGALDLPRSPLAVPLDVGLAFDPFWPRHLRRASQAVARFAPDVIHITGINDMGQLGAWIAHRRRVPLVASWHTNVHEFAARRAGSLLRRWPDGTRAAVVRHVERAVWQGLVRFYRIPHALLAPTDAQVKALETATGRPATLMPRGIDLDLFSPARRSRHESTFRLGYVGRLAPEKNVRLFAHLESQLLAAGLTGFECLIVGDGSERPWLQQTLRTGAFPGVLVGDALARAYAGMDLFVFPSETDTFGNVVLEALASGVPAVVTDKGGPQTLIRHGVDGVVAGSAGEMVEAVRWLMTDREAHARMRQAARVRAQAFSWDAVFDRLYDTYAAVAARRQAASGRSAPSPP